MNSTFTVTRIYRDQHARLRSHVTKMLGAASDAEHKTLLAQLAGSLMMHLKAEDDSLYPRLLSHPNPAVREKAAQFQQTMGDLAASFDAFYTHWIKPGVIAASLPGYVAELHAVIDALATRMDLEDGELYDLAERELSTA